MADQIRDPEAVAEFISRLAFWRRAAITAADIVLFQCDISDAQSFKYAREFLDLFEQWSHSDDTRNQIREASEFLKSKMVASSVENGRVEFRFDGAEMLKLRKLSLYLTTYAQTKVADSRRQSRRK